MKQLPALVLVAVSSVVGSRAHAEPASPVAPVEGVVDEKPTWPALVGFGAAAVGIGIGMGLTTASALADADATRMAETCRDRPNRCDRAAGQAYADERGRLVTGGVVGFVAGGTLLAASIVYIAIPIGAPEATEPRRVVALVPRVGFGAAALGVALTF